MLKITFQSFYLFLAIGKSFSANTSSKQKRRFHLANIVFLFGKGTFYVTKRLVTKRILTFWLQIAHPLNS